MTAQLKFAFRVVALSCLCLAFLQPLAAQRHEVDVAVVVHPDTPISNLSLSEVRKVFLGDRQYWSTNVPVVLLIRAPVARERNVVLKIIYQMSESQFKQYWIEDFSGGGCYSSKSGVLERYVQPVADRDPGCNCVY